jgi:hypothetical protein
VRPWTAAATWRILGTEVVRSGHLLLVVDTESLEEPGRSTIAAPAFTKAQEQVRVQGIAEVRVAFVCAAPMPALMPLASVGIVPELGLDHGERGVDSFTE